MGENGAVDSPGPRFAEGPAARRMVVPVVVTSSTRSRFLPRHRGAAAKLVRGKLQAAGSRASGLAARARGGSSSCRAGFPKAFRHVSGEQLGCRPGATKSAQGMRWAPSTGRRWMAPTARSATFAARRAASGAARSSRLRFLSASSADRSAPSCSPQINVASCGGRLEMHRPDTIRWNPRRGDHTGHMRCRRAAPSETNRHGINRGPCPAVVDRSVDKGREAALR